ncbi:cytoplasmic protein [Bacillus cereus]|nr:cytoplasmic protein [Bacillus cereus]
MAEQKVSAQQRAMMFATATRQYYQTLPTEQVKEEGSTIEFRLPKARLLSRIFLHVKAVATLKSNGASIERDAMSPYKILRRITLDLNNGFSPYIVSGQELYMYNVLRQNPEVLLPGISKQSTNYVENVASTTGKDGSIEFTLPIPVALNERDPVGMVLLQNMESNVTLTIDVDKLANAYNLNATNQDRVDFKSMKVTPMLETFSVPPDPVAFPDISVLKLVQSKRDTFTGGGQSTFELDTGNIYRKILFYVKDKDGNPMSPEDFQGNIELVFNQADTPYSVPASVLTHINHLNLGHPLPKGMYCFDFSNQGVPNLGGFRDYIDTERLTVFWLRFASQKAGDITIVSEKLSRLR